MLKSTIINNKDLFLVLEKKYPYAIDDWGKDENKKISIFRDWIGLFNSLCELEKNYQEERQIDESDFKGDSFHSEKMRELFRPLLINREIFFYKNAINFELFQVYKWCLEIYDLRGQGAGRNKIFQVLRRYQVLEVTFPVQACLLFYSIFTEQLRLKNIGVKYSYSVQNQQLLVEAQKEVLELSKRYGHLYTVNVTYQLKLPNNLSSTIDIRRGFHELHLIEQKIVLDKRLLKVLFKFEDDGLHGCLLNCILIYPMQALSNVKQCLTQLETISETSANGTQIKFQNWGMVLNHIAEVEVVGHIDQSEKLQNFLYWTLGSFYRHDDFFSYCYPLANDGNFIHEQVLEPWALSLKVPKKGIQVKDINRIYSELMNSISDVDEVWSISVLPKTLQKELAIDKIMLSEIVYELRYDSAFNGEVLGCLQVFYTFLKVGDEPFFYIVKFKDLVTDIKPSRLGRQFIYLYNALCQQPEIISQIEELDSMLGQRFQMLLNSQLWVYIKELVRTDNTIISKVETLHTLNQLCGYYRLNQTRIPSYPYTIDDFVASERRTADAYKYFEGLLQGNQLICRFKFYADVEGISFLEKREIFAKHFTEFLRIHKRSSLLKNLNGYFLIWLDEPYEKGFQDRRPPKPYVDVIFIMEFVYGLSYQSFEQDVLNAWKEYKGKKSLIGESLNQFRTRAFQGEYLMHSEESLKSTFVVFEKKNKKLKRALLEKLLPYFTYRHFYLSKLYDDKQDPKIKMFSKGVLSKKSHSK